VTIVGFAGGILTVDSSLKCFVYLEVKGFFFWSLGDIFVSIRRVQADLKGDIERRRERIKHLSMEINKPSLQVDVHHLVNTVAPRS
jgi:hypothetical protein